MQPSAVSTLDAEIGQLVFADSPVGIVLVSETGRFLRANPAFCDFIGYSERELKARTLQSITHPDDRPKKGRRNWSACAEGWGSCSAEKRYIRKSGEVVWGRIDIASSRRGGGRAGLRIVHVADITARKRAELDLQENEDRLQVALKGTAVTVFTQDRNLRYTWAHNPAPGFKIEHVLGKRDEDLYSAEDAAIFTGIKRQVMASGVGRRDEIVAHRPRSIGGDMVHDMTTEPLRDDKGMIVGVICAATDITRWKQMEASLSHERNLYKDLVDSQPAGVYRLLVKAAREWVDNEWVARLATNYTIEMASDLFCGILGITQAQREADATIVAKRIHPEDRPDFISRNVEAMNTLKPFKWVGRIRRHGEVRWVDFLSVPRALANGDVMWTGVLRDITGQKQIQDALRESEARYRILFEQAADAIVVFEPATTRILDFNDAACRRLGYTRDEFSRLRVIDLDVKETPLEIVRHSRRVVTGGHHAFETRQKTKSGDIIDVEVRPKAVTLGGKTVILGVWRDITERKRLEDKQKAINAELEAKVHERTVRLRSLAAELTQAEHRERRRIANVLHEDLQQRLVAIKYRMHQRKERHSKGATVRDTEWLIGELQLAIELSRSLVSQLRPPVLYELGLRAALEWLAKDMQARFGLSVRLTGAKAFHLASDDVNAFAFEAVRELLMNVVKHAGVKRAVVRISWRGTDRVAIEVSDKGGGFVLPPSNHPSSFGLFNIRERIEAFGGSLEIGKRPVKGTCAALILPAARGASKRNL